MDDLRAEKRKRYRIVETNAGSIAVQFRMDILDVDHDPFIPMFRFVETWNFYNERFDSVKEANFFIDNKIENELDSEVKSVIQ